jgi:hypothetical protein
MTDAIFLIAARARFTWAGGRFDIKKGPDLAIRPFFKDLHHAASNAAIDERFFSAF